MLNTKPHLDISGSSVPWNNYISYIIETTDADSMDKKYGSTAAGIAAILKNEFNAMLVSDFELYFEKEEDLTFFLLRFS